MAFLIVDTSIWIDYFDGKPFDLVDDVDQALLETRVVVPPLVISELYSGARTVSQQTMLDEWVDKIPVFTTTIDHWQRVGHLRMFLAKKGVNISTPDAHIAQCAIDVKGYLLSHDGIFLLAAKHCGLQVL